MTLDIPQQRRRANRAAISASLAVGAVAFAVFLPSLSNGFVNWDDDQNFLNNPHYRGLAPANLAWMFTTFHCGPYQPLSWITLGIDYLMWGMNPWGYHLTNILLHAIASGLFVCVAYRLFRLHPSEQAGSRSSESVAIAFAVLVALMWSLHPLRVEAVTWITERREVLCGVLTLVTLANHLHGGRWWSTTLWAAAAMLAKGTAVTLPVLLVLIDLYKSSLIGRLSLPQVRHSIMRHAAVIVLAAAIALVAIFGQQEARAAVDLDRLGILDRLRLFGCGLAFYAWKTVWPAGLAPLYEAPRDRSLLTGMALAGGLGWLAVLALAFILIRRTAALLLLALAYVALLLPVGGLIQVGSQIAADRYSYQPGWVVSLALGSLVLYVTRRVWPTRAVLPVAGVLTIALSVALVSRTLPQQSVWHDTLSLWNHQLAAYPRTGIAHYGIAYEFEHFDPPNDAAAESHYRSAIANIPDYVEAYDRLAALLRRTGRRTEAQQAYEQALSHVPRHLPSLNELADLLWESGKREEAIGRLLELVQADPNSDLSHTLLAKALAADGKPHAAVHEYEAALAVHPHSPDALKGLTLLISTSFDRSVRNAERAVQLAEQLLSVTHRADGQAVLAAAAAYAEAGDFERAVSLVEAFARSASPAQASALQGPLAQFRRHERIRMEPTYP